MLSEADINDYAARQLRKLRNTSGLSQTKLARKVGVAPQQVQKYEWGVNRLSVGRVMQFAKAFDVPLTFFFPKDDENFPTPMPQPTVRFLQLLDKISPQYWDDIYEALKIMARLSAKEPQ